MRPPYRTITYLYTFISWIIVSGCVDSYQPKLSSENAAYLVVDGFLDTNTQSATVKLSRSVGIGLNEPLPAESTAMVSIENKQGDRFVLSENDTVAGTYYAEKMQVNANDIYQLHITTKDGKKYKSSDLIIKSSPPIDNVTWKPTETGVNIYVSSHDPNNQTHYYKWTYTEVWEYSTTYFSYFKMANGVPSFRQPKDFIYTCWNSQHDDEILIHSTVQLNTDVVNDFLIASVPKGSVKLSYRYSILVEQRALDENAYNYWKLLEKTTENLGGLFDPLPSQVSGNVYNPDDSSEPVLGYFSVGGSQQKRIFIYYQDLPPSLQGYSSGIQCKQILFPVDSLSALGSYILLSSVGQPVTTGYMVSTIDCADCRFMGGVNSKPDFWPQ
jgi:hypothetical protein